LISFFVFIGRLTGRSRWCLHRIETSACPTAHAAWPDIINVETVSGSVAGNAALSLLMS
jgi:hypothetical protein